MRPQRPRAFFPILAVAGLLAACAPEATTADAAAPVIAAVELPPIPVCRDEMRAFVELARLAKLHGDGWIVFGPAVDALKQQIIDCIDENHTQLGEF
jgi:hypothetical protein